MTDPGQREIPGPAAAAASQQRRASPPLRQAPRGTDGPPPDPALAGAPRDGPRGAAAAEPAPFFREPEDATRWRRDDDAFPAAGEGPEPPPAGSKPPSRRMSTATPERSAAVSVVSEHPAAEVGAEEAAEEEPVISGQELHNQLAAEAATPLELAVLAKLKLWEEDDGDRVYTLEEMMDIVRWVEERLERREQERVAPRPWTTVLWEAPRLTQALLCLAAIAVLLLLLFLLCLATGLALEAVAEPSGNLRTPGQHSRRPAAAVAAVHLRGLAAYQGLPMSELRLAQDVVFTHQGDFHFHRLAGVSRLVGGGVRLDTEDGSAIRLVGDYAGLSRPRHCAESAAVEEQLQLTETQGSRWATAGTFQNLALR